uniref:Reverse transcriptase zinc-binding domain-containing protein n=1 Tax=Photinus pyralis TaxID=7054 RepID=A0A1Y1KRE3_PHOPY
MILTKEKRRQYRRLNTELKKKTDEAKKRWWGNQCNEIERERCLRRPTQYTRIMPLIKINPCYYNYKSNRFYQSSIVRLKTAHGRFPAHLHRINLIPSAQCTFCNYEVADLNHLVLACPQNTNYTNIMMEDLLKLGLTHPLDVPTILSTNDKGVYDILVRFVAASKLPL